MKQTVKRTPPKAKLDDLLKDNLPVYVRNRSKPRGEVTVTVFRPDGNPYLIVVPKTWVPICITDQVSPETLKNSDDFRLNLQKGLLELLSVEAAQELLNDPDASEELSRLNISKYSSYEEDLKSADTVTDFATSLENSDQVNPLVRDILGRDVSPSEQYHLMRAEEDVLNGEDFKYIALNGSGKVKEWAQSKLS